MAERFNPPIGTFTDGLLPASESPCLIDRDFLNEVGHATKLVTPTDELTGVPLVLMSTQDLPPIDLEKKNIERIADWHHPFHPRARFVNKTKALAALRSVRKQWVMYDRHHEGLPEAYHSNY